MSKINRDWAKSFFLEAKILTEEEIKSFIDFCDFGIEMPNEKHNKVFLYISASKPLPTKIYTKLTNYPEEKLQIFISSKSLTDVSGVDEYIQTWLKKNHGDSFILQDLFQRNNYSIENDTLTVKYVSQSELDELKKIQSELIFYLKTAINFEIKNFVLQLNKEKQNKILEAENLRKKNIQELIQQSQKMMSKVDKYDRMYRVSGKFVPLREIDDGDLIGSYTNVAGEIFNIEKKAAAKNPNVVIYNFKIYDYEEGALLCKYVLNKAFLDDNKRRIKPMPEGFMETFKVGDWVNVSCKLESNEYTKHQIVGSVVRMCHAERPTHLIPKDDANKKRVELLIHSNMTAYEGLDSATKIYNHAKQCGYQAVGIIDRNNVQSIPEIFNNANQHKDIKPLYGCEFEIIDKFIPIVVNPIDKPLIDADYVIFDIETTGLYPEFDDLLEFGAIKYKDGSIVDRIDFFVKPTKELTNIAINLSHITNEMVENAIGQKEALLKIKQWIGNDVLVAHNGIKFDLNFLNKLCERFGVEPINNCLIDTLEISHAINKKFSKHTLGTLVSKLRVEYNPLVAHRADKDSEYLLEVWKYFMKTLITQQGVDNIKNINGKLQTAALRASRRGYFVDVYIKNQKGIRNLFDLLSLALTKQLYQKDDDEEVAVLSNGQPKLHFSDFGKYRENLIICPHPFEGDVWESAISETQAELEKKINQYDYIFVAPAKNIEHLAVQEKITRTDATKALKKIIETSTKLNKKVCAVSDAYYSMPFERKIHEIYVYTKQLGGKRHPLYRHDGTTFVPDLHFMTTDQMIDAFKFVGNDKLIKDIVINNTIAFADSIEKVVPIDTREEALCKPDMPDTEKKLLDLVWKTAKDIYGEPLDKAIEERINKELNGICSKGYGVIYWISHLLIEKTNKDGYPVGSRGSVGSSIVAFLSNVTEVNPLPPHYVCPKCKHYEPYPDTTVDGFDLPPKKCPKCGTDMRRDGHNIPFETFLGFDGKKLPDIDLNFSGEYQSKAHEFIRDMFGPTQAFRAGTIGTVAEKTAIGYVKSYYEQIDPNKKPNNTLVDALANKCQGVKRTTGQHPGGIIVVPKGHSITEFTPYNYPSNDKTKGWFTTHFDYHSIEKNLLKFDILGHDEPTILKHLQDITGVDLKTIPNSDAKVLGLFADSKGLGINDEEYDQEKIATIALPEFGTTNTRKIVLKTKPTCVEDLIRISGLSHGTGVWQGNAEELIAKGAKLSQVACSREDIFTYLTKCGMDYSHAFQAVEKIRKGNGVPENYEKEMRDANVPAWYIESCKKIKYLFPRAHATAYVLDAIRTAWFKVYYPTQFYAVWFSARSDVFDIETVIKGQQEVKKVYEDYKTRAKSRNPEVPLSKKQTDLIPIFEVCLEMFARGVTMKNIDINKSTASSFIAQGNSILPPFTSLDGLGKEAADSIVAARNEKPFTSILDLQKRTKLTSTLIQKLKDLHVLDNLDSDDQMSLF